jgi:hypothetical protein
MVYSLLQLIWNFDLKDATGRNTNLLRKAHRPNVGELARIP